MSLRAWRRSNESACGEAAVAASAGEPGRPLLAMMKVLYSGNELGVIGGWTNGDGKK